MNHCTAAIWELLIRQGLRGEKRVLHLCDIPVREPTAVTPDISTCFSSKQLGNNEPPRITSEEKVWKASRQPSSSRMQMSVILLSTIIAASLGACFFLSSNYFFQKTRSLELWAMGIKNSIPDHILRQEDYTYNMGGETYVELDPKALRCGHHSAWARAQGFKVGQARAAHTFSGTASALSSIFSKWIASSPLDARMIKRKRTPIVKECAS